MTDVNLLTVRRYGRVLYRGNRLYTVRTATATARVFDIGIRVSDDLTWSHAPFSRDYRDNDEITRRHAWKIKIWTTGDHVFLHDGDRQRFI